MDYSAENHIKMPHLLLIAGNGRNVGKTFLACRIIEFLAKNHEVTGLKISPHFHPVSDSEVVFNNEYFIILKENKISTKDSSLMLQAGAKQVFFVMVQPGYLNAAFEKLQEFLPGNIIVCESGELHEVIEPGLFLFVKRSGEDVVKTQYLKYLPVIVNNDGKCFDFDVERIELRNNRINLKS